MAQEIREVLNRRTDLSTFVVHLTRTTEKRTAREALDRIIEARTLRAVSPMGWAKEEDNWLEPDEQTQRVVCFSEAPLEHVYSLVADIWGRSVKLEPYGVAFTKVVARRAGINPIWYVDQTIGRTWEVSKALNAMKEEAVASGEFHESHFAKIAPYFEQMGRWLGGSQKEFWWEREWRAVGNVYLPFGKVIWLSPENEIDSLVDGDGFLVKDRENVIDPRWGLEQIIAHLAGLQSSDITPFGAR